MSLEERRRGIMARGRIGLRTLLSAATLVGAAARAAPGPSPVDADGEIVVVLEDHRFVPAEIHVPANTRVRLLVRNRDATADEFDSTSLKVEKVIGGGSEGVVRLRPLDPGRYPFMGEFHAETAQGVVVAE